MRRGETLMCECSPHLPLSFSSLFLFSPPYPFSLSSLHFCSTVLIEVFLLLHCKVVNSRCLSWEWERNCRSCVRLSAFLKNKWTDGYGGRRRRGAEVTHSVFTHTHFSGVNSFMFFQSVQSNRAPPVNQCCVLQRTGSAWWEALLQLGVRDKY